jgi:hypothetical protein
MKKIFPLVVILFLCISTSSAQSKKVKTEPVGKWNFEAPYAPEGYTKGTVEIGYADKKYSASMTFTDLGYSLTGEKVSMKNDSIFFMIWVESTDVNISLKLVDKTQITGAAVYYEGTVPLTLTREPETKQ